MKIVFFMLPLTIYERYIRRLQKIEQKRAYTSGLYAGLQKHRIVPGHQKGRYDINNVVLCSYKQHIIAHWLRYISYGQSGDKIAYTVMSNQTQKAHLLISQMAGKLAGKKNVTSGWLAKLHVHITEHDPKLRSRAGKLGAKATIAKQRLNKTGFFNPTNQTQKLGNLVRWGIVIQGVRIPFKKLSSTFVNYFLVYGDKKSY